MNRLIVVGVNTSVSITLERKSGTNRVADAIFALNKLLELEQPGQEMTEDVRGLFLEGLFLTGQAYYNTRQFDMAFPPLRRITRDFPNTSWANQAFYYIGMCHYAKGNWNRAIEALSLVGTFVDPESPAVELVEAGRRFYVRIEDGDLPVLQRDGTTVSEWVAGIGLGLPVQVDSGYLDIGVQYGRTGNLDDAGLRESFLRFHVGITYGRFARAF